MKTSFHYMKPIVILVFCVMISGCRKTTTEEPIQEWIPGPLDVIAYISREPDDTNVCINLINNKGTCKVFSVPHGLVNMELSPDGSHIVFAKWYREWRNSLEMIEIKGQTVTSKTLLNRLMYESFDPVWSHDGTRLVIYTNDSLCTINADGTDLRYLLYGRNAQWSPDGLQIACNGSSSEGNDKKIFLVSPDGSDCRFLTNGTRPFWTPDGMRLVYFQSTSCFTYTMADSSVKKLTDLPVDIFWDLSLSTWSPDRTQLCCFLQNGNYSLIKTDGTSVTTFSNIDGNIRWSPDGRQVLFCRHLYADFRAGQVANIDGTQIYTLEGCPSCWGLYDWN